MRGKQFFVEPHFSFWILIASSQTRAKVWIQDYMTACDSLIDCIEYSENFDASRVKVAIFDTGVDWNDPYIRGAKERIVKWRKWAGDRECEAPGSPQQVHDEAGHGTHITALLLKIAPEAEVYVGRVADGNGAMVAAEKIAEVSFLQCLHTLVPSNHHPYLN